MDTHGTVNDRQGQAGGLEVEELKQVVAELRDQVLGMQVRDVALVRQRDDLVVVLVNEADKRALHIALGSRRARLCTTRRRFSLQEFATGPRADRLRAALKDTHLVSVEHTAGEKRCSLGFAGGAGASVLEVELFGARGLWCLVDGDGHILQLSRPARGMAPGDSYAPPGTPPRSGGGGRSSRFCAPVLEAVDAHFTDLDREAEELEGRLVLHRALAKRRKKLVARLAGLQQQTEQIDGVDELRRVADLMLAHSTEVARGAAEMTVPDPDHPGEHLRLTLDPAKPVVSQAEALYHRARKLADGAEVSRRRRAEAKAELANVASLEASLDGGEPLEELRRRLQAAGYLPPPTRPKAHQPAAVPFRRYTSLEGHPILVGRNNTENDRLSIQVARGNDLWFHVGGGRAGSHVVVRLPRGKTASLETLLDAGTLAVHFSKYRGTPVCEVIYAQAKHVRKPRGLPPGRVHVTQTKSLGIRLETGRLERLLGSPENA